MSPKAHNRYLSADTVMFRYLAKNGVRRYLHLLKVFAAAYPQLEGASVLIAQLSQTPFCVAYMYEDESSTSHQSRPDATTKEIAVMKRANECYLIDNERLSKLFNPPRVPPIEGSAMLARMYENLGARWITSDLQQKTLPRGTPKITEATKEFKQLLNERYGKINLSSRLPNPILTRMSSRVQETFAYAHYARKASKAPPTRR